MNTLSPSLDISLEKAAALLKAGGVVAFPTETVYGLGADAWNPDAVAQIFTLKGRPPDNPLIVHVSSLGMVDKLAAEVNEDALRLMAEFWPGPLALIFPKRAEVLDIVTAGLNTVAVRMPDHPVPLRLIHETGPLAAPSANTSGRPSPTRSDHVVQDFEDRVPVLEGGVCQYGLESTVLDLSEKPYTILRPGHITQSAIEHILGMPVRVTRQTQERSTDELAPKSPGMKYSHYAPDAGVRWMTPQELQRTQALLASTLYLVHRDREQILPVPSGVTLVHYHQNYQEMARDLYDRFRMADLQRFSEVAIEPFHAETAEQTEALHNRIRKAIG